MVKILSAENKLLDFFAEIITETNTIAIKKVEFYIMYIFISVISIYKLNTEL